MIHTESEVREVLKRDLVRYVSQAEMARDIGVGVANLNEILTGRRRPTGKVLHRYGFKRIIAFTRD